MLGFYPIASRPIAGLAPVVAPLTGSVPINVSINGTLKGLGRLTSSVPIAVSISGTLKGLGRLTGSVPVSVAFAGTARGLGRLAGSLGISVSFSGMLSIPMPKGALTVAGLTPIGYVVTLDNTSTFRPDSNTARFEVDK